MTPESLPVVVTGAGPVGVAAAAHLVDRGEIPIVLESGTQVGTAVRQWAHVRVFSPWRYNVDPVAAAMLAKAGWIAPNRIICRPARSSWPTTSRRWRRSRRSRRRYGCRALGESS